MKYLRNRNKQGYQSYLEEKPSSQDSNSPGYVSHQDPEVVNFFGKGEVRSGSAVEYTGQSTTDHRIETLLNSIKRNHFTYYVKGGFSRSRRCFLTPMQVANMHNLNIDECLFEVKDPRIEEAVKIYGLTIISPNQHRFNHDSES